VLLQPAGAWRAGANKKCGSEAQTSETATIGHRVRPWMHATRAHHYPKPKLPWRPNTAKKNTKIAKEMILGGWPPSKIRQE